MTNDILAELLATSSDSEREWLVLQLTLVNLPPMLREAVKVAAILHWFDAAFLNTLLEPDNITLDAHTFSILISLSFIETFSGQFFNIHERSRQLLLTNFWRDDLARYHNLVHRAAVYCTQQNQSDTNWRIETIFYKLSASDAGAEYAFTSQCNEWFNQLDYYKVETLIRLASEVIKAGLPMENFVPQISYWQDNLDHAYRAMKINTGVAPYRLQPERTETIKLPRQPSYARSLSSLVKPKTYLNGILFIFSRQVIRLAPTIILLAIISLGSFSLLISAQEALPGDLIYPVKQWIRYQQLNLSPPAMRPQMLKDYEHEFQEDVQKAAVKAQQTAGDSQDKNRGVIRIRSILTFHNNAGAFMVIGGLQVLKKYQPDANNDHDFRDMTIIGKPAPGDQVILEYQILPQSGNMAAPIVQGIRLRVLPQAQVLPTPVPSNTPIPTNTPIPIYTPAPTEPCVVTGLHGWTPTRIKPGDTLSSIAQQTGASVDQLRLVNCLKSDTINGVILAPEPLATPKPLATVEGPN